MTEVEPLIEQLAIAETNYLAARLNKDRSEASWYLSLVNQQGTVKERESKILASPEWANLQVVLNTAEVEFHKAKYTLQAAMRETNG